MAPHTYIAQTSDAGAHVLARAKLSDSGCGLTTFTGADSTRANARINRFNPPRFFVGASSAKAQQRAARYPDKAQHAAAVAADTKRHDKRMARLADVHV